MEDIIETIMMALLDRVTIRKNGNASVKSAVKIMKKYGVYSISATVPMGATFRDSVSIHVQGDEKNMNAELVASIHASHLLKVSEKENLDSEIICYTVSRNFLINGLNFNVRIVMVRQRMEGEELVK